MCANGVTVSACVLLALTVVGSPLKCPSGLSCRAGESELLQSAADAVLSEKYVESTLDAVAGLAYDEPVARGGRKFTQIAHMVLWEAAIDWAVNAGSNGLEIDVTFKNTGTPQGQGAQMHRAYHGAPCDCTCLPILFEPMGDGLCHTEAFGGAGFPVDCGFDGPIVPLFEYIAKEYPSTYLIHLDNKVGGNYEHLEYFSGSRGSVDDEATGSNLIGTFHQHAWGQGYRGNVAVGGCGDTGATWSGYMFVGALKKAADLGKDASVWISWEAKSDGSAELSVEEYKGALAELRGRAQSSQNFKSVRPVGISSCGHITAFQGNKAIFTASIEARDAGSFDFIFAWTVDATGHMKWYLGADADAMITNEPHTLTAILDEEGIQKASV